MQSMEIEAPSAALPPPDVVTFKELNDVLRAWPNFGAFSIFMTHPLISWQDGVTKLLPLALIIAQSLLPLGLVQGPLALLRHQQAHEGHIVHARERVEERLLHSEEVVHVCGRDRIELSASPTLRGNRSR